MNDFAVSINSNTPAFIQILLLILWGIGVVIMLCFILHSFIRLRIYEKSSLPLQNLQVRRIYNQCCKEMKLKKEIPLYTTAFFKSPVTVGFVKPRIYLPIYLISDFNPKDLRFMLLHELQHYRQKDAIVIHFMNLACILYWFNPAVRYALKEMRCDRELACDAAVLNLLDETDYQAYGTTLLNFAEKISHSPFPFATGISGSMKQMKRRILNITFFQKEKNCPNIHAIIVYILLMGLLLWHIPVFASNISCETKYDLPKDMKNVSSINLTDFFGTYEGSFVLYNAKKDSWNIFNLKNAKTRVSPNSTYKIYGALLGLESGIVTPEHSTMLWNGEDYPFDTWESDQTLSSAMENSVNWYFQSIDSKIGLDSVKSFLQHIQYGNQQTSADINFYWTDSSLKISPIEQVELLKKFHNNTFQFTSKNLAAVKDSIHLSSTLEGSLYGKTGTGRIDGNDVNGWFIGYVEKSDNVYYFATNIQGEANATGSKATKITTSILSELNIWN